MLRTLKAFIELTKPRITALLLFVALASCLLAAGGRPGRGRLAWLAAGTWLLAAGAFSLNHLLERDTDARMPRTRGRPLPSGRVRPGAALGVGLAASLLSLLVFALWLGGLAALLAAATLAGYLLLYTPLKRRTPLHTAIGSVSGGMPVLLGWAGGAGRLEADAWILFAVLFLWQFPHFLAIGLLYREDYARAGVRVLPADARTDRWTGPVVLGAQALLVPLGALTALTGRVHPAAGAAAALLGLAFLVFGLLALRGRRQRGPVRRLILASVGYLALLFTLLLAGAVSASP